MAFGDDEEILQDFLVEAGEIIDLLSEQLVDLERRPDDRDLLNAIFRGFHTVKGGAGFLQLTAMVDCCHVTENLFDILRNGERQVTAELMDVVLQALDTVNHQFAEVNSRQELTPAPPELIHKLECLVSGKDLADSSLTTEPEQTAAAAPSSSVEDDGLFDTGDATGAASGNIDITDDEFEDFLDAINDSPTDETSSTAPVPVSASDSDEISEDEFEALLDNLHGSGKAPNVTGSGQVPPVQSAAPTSPATSSPSSSDEITEDEFEGLLDQLHGVGRAPTDSAQPPSQPATTSATPSTSASSSGTDELITDDEFEDLLDQLHGKGKGPIVPGADSVPSPAPQAAAPAPKAAPKPVAAPPSQPKAQAAPPAAPREAKLEAVPERKAPPPAPNKGRDSSSGAAPGGETTVRVDTQRLDDIMNMVGELVLVRNRLVRLGNEGADEKMQKAVANLDVVTADLQSSVMKTRMQPIKKVFGRFPRVVRDLARNLKKEINLELVGEETDLDKNLVEALADPLVHLVRNSVDHGIELPNVREENGKSRVGKVILGAEQEGDHILLSITDDGGGMDADKLRSIAVEKGILDADAAARLSDTEAFNLIFAPGFSTKKEISDVSGRGVGMDVVKTKIAQLNGSIDIQSKLGEGTRIVIKVPLTLAIMPTLMIMVGDQAFALPLVSVNEIFHMDLTKSNIVDSQECITIREKAIPIFHLKKWLIRNNRHAETPKEGHIVIVSVGTQRVGFVVDQLIGQEEVVIKPLGKMLHGTAGMAGATITGDGTIALILDVPSMLKRYAGAA